MMATENPVISLEKLNDIESRIRNYQETTDDYKLLDFFLSSVGVQQDYIKNSLLQNGMTDYYTYIRERNNAENKIIVGKIDGIVLGALSFLKSFVIKNNL